VSEKCRKNLIEGKMKAEIVIFKEKLKKGYPVKLSLSHNNKTRRISKFDIYLEKIEQWDKKKKIVAKHPQAIEINTELNKVKSVINEIDLMMMKIPDSYKSIEMYEKKFDELYFDDIKGETEDKNSIYSLFLKVEKDLIAESRFGSQKDYKCTRQQIFKYLPSNINFEQFTLNELESLYTKLIKDGRSVNTVAVYMRHLRAIINRAVKYGYIEFNQNPFRLFSIKTVKTGKRALNKDNLKMLFEFAPENKDQKFALEIFKLVFYLGGINVTDLITLKKEVLANNQVE